MGNPATRAAGPSLTPAPLTHGPPLTPAPPTLQGLSGTHAAAAARCSLSPTSLSDLLLFSCMQGIYVHSLVKLMMRCKN